MKGMAYRYLLAFLVKASLGNLRTWTQTTSLDNPSLWREQRLPCDGQSIVLPNDVIYVPEAFRFGHETVLPTNGMLLFHSSGKNTYEKEFLKITYEARKQSRKS